MFINSLRTASIRVVAMLAKKVQPALAYSINLQPTSGLALLGLDEYCFNICFLLYFSSGLTL